MEQFDAIVIGTGQAGSPLAKTLAEHGLKTALIERATPGGSCVNWGCTPTKTMLASAHAAHLSRTAQEVGVHNSQTSIDFKEIIKRRDKLVEKSRNKIHEKMMEAEHIELIYGEASFSGPKEIIVRLNDSTESRSLQAEKIFINVGASPHLPELNGLDNVNYYTYKSIMELQELPEHLIILGGSYIGLEFGQMFRRFGAKVSIIETGGLLADREDDDVTKALLEVLKKEGLEFYLNTELEKVEKQGNSLHLTLKTDKALTGSHLLITTGTIPNTKALNLQKAGIKTNEHGHITVNEHLQTSVDGVFALGDCKGGPEFTHISYDDHRIVKDYLFGDRKRSTHDRPLPYTMFTKPELGRVGLNEKQARKEGRKYKIAKLPASKIARAAEANQTEGLLKVLIDPADDRIIGAACLAETGGELMSMLQIAMMGRLPYQQLRDGIFAHPCWAESFNRLFRKISDPD